MFALIKLILFVAVFESIKCDWTLVPVDPTQYGSQYPACQTALQYPVNLNTSAAIYYQSLAPISFVNFDKPLYFNFTNNGYTIFAYQTRDLSVSPFLIGSDFGSDVYVFQQFHFHWGADVYSGSQHLINNKAYPLELHIVHQSYSGYIGVVAFLFELSNSDNPGLLDLIRIVGNDLGKNGSTIANLTLSNILPNIATANKDGYYRYLGSFSTPPCNDGVIWNVYKDRIPISGNQLLYFYKNSIKFNTRSVTNLSPRPLFVSVQNTQ